MILRAKHNFFISWFFNLYSVWKVRRNFKPVRVLGNFTQKDLPLLLLSNHVSWWDGFWVMYLNRTLFRKKFHFMMLEEQLRKFWFFNYTGGFSVSKRSRSVLETLDYTSSLLEDNRNLVLIFPQGEIRSMYEEDFRFEKGLEKIIRGVRGQIQVLFIASLVDYFSSPVPGLYMYLREYEAPLGSLSDVEEAYNGFYRESLEQQKHLKTGE